MKRILTLFLALMLCIPFLFTAADAGQDGPTKSEIQAKWKTVTSSSTIFDSQPSITAPYASGELTDEFLESGITYLNFVRFVAGLPEVELDDTLNTDAQYGAVCLAAIDQLTHTPSRPAGMDDAFYDRAYGATTSANISARWGYDPLKSLQSAVSGCMDDNSSLNNLSCVGHRRWLLNPALGKVGFGYARSAENWDYIVNHVFDRSGPGCDYDFISWPVAGNHPTILFNTENPWSITLNPSLYQKPSADSVRITITRASDGKTWSFDSTTGAPSSTSKPYMTVNNQGYGVSNCIIFHPGSDNVDSYEGVFTVDVSGIYTKSGSPAELHYQVDFFDITKCDHAYEHTSVAPTCTEDGVTTYTCHLCGHSYTETAPALGHAYTAVRTEPTCTDPGFTVHTCDRCGDSYTETSPALGHDWQGTECGRCGEMRRTPFDDVVPGSFYEEPVAWAVEKGITNGLDAVHFGPNAQCNRAQVVTFLWRAAGSPEPAATVHPFVDVQAGSFYEKAVLWALETGVTNGLDATHFGPNVQCNRAQVVTFLWRSMGCPLSGDANPFTDVKAGDFYFDAVLWALEKGITNGLTATQFGVNAACNRAQIVTFLYRTFN